MDLRVQKTYAALIAAFDELLHEKEFEKISVKEICDAAMIRRPTFYKHFLDKYDFLTFFIKHKMNEMFDAAVEKMTSDAKADDFFILVFEQLLDQFDNLLYLIFSIQMNANIISELESVRNYGKTMLSKYVSNDGAATEEGLDLAVSYKGQIIMGVTIQSVFWYKENKDKVSRQEIVDMYRGTLERLSERG